MPRSVRVDLYSLAREAAGRARIDEEVDAGGVPLEALLADLGHRYPGLARIIRVSRIVVNGEYVRPGSRRLVPGDEVAIHPPYSGG